MDVVELAKALVRCDTTSGRGITEVIELIRPMFTKRGWSTSVGTGEQFLLAVSPYGGARLLFACHADTVPVGVENEWSWDPHGGTVVDGLLCGRGSVDMKGGLAAAVVALLEAPDDAPLALLVTDNEETGCQGARAALETLKDLEVRAVVVPEPTNNELCVGHRGALWLRVHARGRAAHASAPKLGDNAILKLLPLLATLASAQPPTTSPGLGESTVCVTAIKGGTAPNVVPEAASFMIDMRYTSAGDQSWLTHLIGAAGNDLWIEVVDDLAPVSTSPDDTWVRSLGMSAAKARTVPFFTDASVLGPRLPDVPVIILGPGSPRKAHVIDEAAPVCELNEARTIYSEIIALSTSRAAGRGASWSTTL